MPYIPQEVRKRLDPLIDQLSKEVVLGGDLNYVMTRLAIEFTKDIGVSYSTLSETLATFEAAKLEFYRRFVAPYEDKKIEQNGDVDGFPEQT